MPLPNVLRLPENKRLAYVAFDLAAHTLNGLAAHLLCFGEPEYAGVMAGFAVGLEEQREKVRREHATDRAGVDFVKAG